MSTDPLPRDNIQACEEHGIVTDRDIGCVACRTDAETRPEDFLDESVVATDLQWKIEPETLLELMPLQREYLDDVGQGPAWIAVAVLPEDRLPAGYNRPERWFNVVRYEWGPYVKTIMHDDEARETIDTLHEHGYGDGGEGEDS